MNTIAPKRSFDEMRQKLTTVASTDERDGTENPLVKRAKHDLARLDRAVLEHYVTQCIVHQALPNLRQIEQIAGLSARTAAENLEARSAHTTVVSADLYAASAVEDNPLFSLLPPELLCLIMMFLPIRDRLTCAIAVCRPWRSFLSEPSLWSSLSLILNRNSFKPMLVGPNNARRLMGMIGRHLTSFGLFSESDSITTTTLIREMNWDQLLNISLGGKAVTIPAAQSLVRKFPAFPKLKRLRLRFLSTQSAAKILFPHFLAHSPSLVSLDFYACFIDREVAATWVRHAQSARNGGHPLLKSLHVTGQVWSDFKVSALPVLLWGFPELEDLSFSQLHLDNLSTAALPSFDQISLPRLRRLSIGLGRPMHNDGSSSSTLPHASIAIGLMLRVILGAAPNLEFLEIWRPQEYIGDVARRRGQVEGRPFNFDSAFRGKTFPNLRELHLSHVFVSADEVASASFPVLDTAMLRIAKAHQDILSATSAAWEKVAPLLRFNSILPLGVSNNTNLPRTLKLVAGSPEVGKAENHYY